MQQTTEDISQHVNGKHLNGSQDSVLPNGLRSEEATEMLNKVPSWVLRWGSIAVIIVIALFIIVSVFISYPDEVSCSATVNMQPAFTSFGVPVDGAKIANVYAQNGQQVNEGTIVAEIENTTGYAHILLYDTTTNAMYRAIVAGDNLPDITQPTHTLPIDEISMYYQNLMNDYDNLRQLYADANRVKMKASKATLERSIMMIKSYIKNWRRQYLLIAPMSGILSYQKDIELGKRYNKTDAMFSVMPLHYTYTAEIYIPPALLLQVQQAGKVHISISDFDEKMYGHINASIDDISLIPHSIQRDDNTTHLRYIAHVNLGGTIVTNQNKKLPAFGIADADAIFYTKDKSLLSRFMSQFIAKNK